MLRKEEILERTSNGLSVFKHYVPGNWRIGRNFLNPLYEDNKASCNIYFDRRSGIYKMKDFGNDNYSGDCFFFVGQLKGLDCNNSMDFVEILETIDRDLGLGLATGNPIPVTRNSCRVVDNILEETPEKESKPYQFREQKFPLAELMYWQQYGITPEILELYKVCSLRDFQSVTADGTQFTYTSSVTEPMYGYKSKRYIKLYRPFSKTRFLYGGNFGDNYCFGLEQLPAKGDTLFITGGEKDVMSLAAHGFHAICFNSETVTVPPTLIYKLTFRFKHIILLYDTDFIRFKIVDKKVAKRTAIQETVIDPVRSYNEILVIGGKSTVRTVYTVPQFTIPDDKILVIELVEKNGGRHQTIRVENSDIVAAKVINELKIK